MKHDVTVPSPGESISEVYIGTWLKQSGDKVEKGEVLVDLETQKATFEIEAEWSGQIEVLVPARGEKVNVGDVIARIDTSMARGEKGASAASSKTPSTPSAPQVKAAAAKTDIPLSPAVRKIVAEKELDPIRVAGSGKDGRILKEDVRYLDPASRSRVTSQPSEVPVQGASKPATPQFSSLYQVVVDTARGDRKVPAARIRRQIAANLVLAQHTAAILTTFNEVDMSAVMALRKRHKEGFQKKYGVSMGMVGIFALATARALKAFPLVNATFTGEDVIYHDYIDLSVAVSTERGLVVPVIRDVDKMTLPQFEKTLADLSQKAGSGKLSIPEMTGGTFTVSNGGVFGSLLSTPILNMPQSAILGLHKIEERPVAIQGKVEVRPMMYLALSYDHRIIDGKEAVQFLVWVKEAIEKPDLILQEGTLS